MSQGRGRRGGPNPAPAQAPEPAQERASPVGTGATAPGRAAAPTYASSQSGGGMPLDGHSLGSPDPNWDMDVTVLAFAQWANEMKSRSQNSSQQMQAEMSMIRNAVSSNQTDLGDFKRHGAAIQSQMQSEINEIRETLSNVFMEITAAVRNNAAADQDIKLKIQSLNEQAVRNETAFAQLADAADQSQSKLRTAVTEMQLQSERMRDDLGQLSRQTETLEGNVGEKVERISTDMDNLSQDLRVQLERRRDHLKKMVNDVVAIGESLQNLVQDFGEQRRGAGGTQGRIQSSLQMIEQAAGRQPLPTSAQGLQATADALRPRMAGSCYVTQVPGQPGAPMQAAGLYAGAPRPSTGQVIYR